jgi:hypothetical protein
MGALERLRENMISRGISIGSSEKEDRDEK